MKKKIVVVALISGALGSSYAQDWDNYGTMNRERHGVSGRFSSDEDGRAFSQFRTVQQEPSAVQSHEYQQTTPQYREPQYRDASRVPEYREPRHQDFSRPVAYQEQAYRDQDSVSQYRDQVSASPYREPQVSQYAEPDRVQYGEPGNTQYREPGNTQYREQGNTQYREQGDTQYREQGDTQYGDPSLSQYRDQSPSSYQEKNVSRYRGQAQDSYEAPSRYYDDSAYGGSSFAGNSVAPAQYSQSKAAYRQGFDEGSFVMNDQTGEKVVLGQGGTPAVASQSGQANRFAANDSEWNRSLPQSSAVLPHEDRRISRSASFDDNFGAGTEPGQAMEQPLRYESQRQTMPQRRENVHENQTSYRKKPLIGNPFRGITRTVGRLFGR